MSLHRRNPRRDANEPAIVDALERMGFSVSRVSGAGVPDLLVGKWPSFLRMVEIKVEKGRYTPAQVQWRQTWRGPAPITLRSLEDVQRFCLLACEAGPSGDRGIPSPPPPEGQS